MLTVRSISIAIIYVLATRTGVLDSDPMLWFAMMLMPTGPPAMILVALSDVNHSPETEKMAIAKFLTVSLASPWLVDLKLTELSIRSCTESHH